MIEQQKYKEQFFSQLYEEYLERIYRFIYFKVSSESIAQDLTSEVFTRLWKQISLNKEVKNPSAFLFKLARNIIIDYYRAHDKEKRNTNIDSIVSTLEDKKQNIHNDAQIKEEYAAVTCAMDKMKEEYRQAVHLYYVEQEPIIEVAKSLGKSQGAARVIISRGMKQLRQILES
ncbi:MAG: RNA polymerase sigma factor [Candidatus Paceibacterota bacterium]|jgi:RNA polymerase sigma-70 factor (ECF subfamily)|nr:RNA polymerase sigma factor [bacterium]